MLRVKPHFSDASASMCVKEKERDSNSICQTNRLSVCDLLLLLRRSYEKSKSSTMSMVFAILLKIMIQDEHKTTKMDRRIKYMKKKTVLRNVKS